MLTKKYPGAFGLSLSYTTRDLEDGISRSQEPHRLLWHCSLHALLHALPRSVAACSASTGVIGYDISLKLQVELGIPIVANIESINVSHYIFPNIHVRVARRSPIQYRYTNKIINKDSQEASSLFNNNLDALAFNGSGIASLDGNSLLLVFVLG